MESLAGSRRKFVDNRVDPLMPRRLTFLLPEGAVGTLPTQGTCPRRQRRDHPRCPRDGAAAAEMTSRPAELSTRRRWPTGRSLRALPCPSSGGPPGTFSGGIGRRGAIGIPVSIPPPTEEARATPPALCLDLTRSSLRVRAYPAGLGRCLRPPRPARPTRCARGGRPCPNRPGASPGHRPRLGPRRPRRPRRVAPGHPLR